MVIMMVILVVVMVVIMMAILVVMVVVVLVVVEIESHFETLVQFESRFGLDYQSHFHMQLQIKELSTQRFASFSLNKDRI